MVTGVSVPPVSLSTSSAEPDVVVSPALAVFAHPDDAELACAGTLAKWSRAGAEVHVVSVCRGEKGSATRIDPAVLAATRAAESEAAASILGLASWSTLGFDDGEVNDDVSLRGALVALIRHIRPTVVVGGDPTSVFFGSGYVNHRDHRIVGWAVLNAVSPAAANPNYHPEAGSPHQVSEVLLSGSLESDHWIDIAETVKAKIASLRCHESQLGGGGELGADAPLIAEMVMDRAAAEGRAASLAFAESFRRLRLV